MKIHRIRFAALFLVICMILSSCGLSELAGGKLSEFTKAAETIGSVAEESAAGTEKQAADPGTAPEGAGTDLETVPTHESLSAESTSAPTIVPGPAETAEAQMSEADTSLAVTTEPDAPEVSSSFWVKFLDVGQGDAALVQCDGHYMLIDGGDKSNSSLIYSVLRSYGAEKLDLLVCSHPHTDHVGGLSGALNFASADLVLCPYWSYDSKGFEDFKEYAAKNGGGIKLPVVGDHFELGSASVNILAVNSAEGVNNKSIVLRITYGETSFLFVGDIEREAEQAILGSKYAADLKSTVLKVGHHGSSDSTTYPFLREVMPDIAVISAGTGNPYGHPHDNTLSRLRDAEAAVYRTDLQGDILCTSDGHQVLVTVEKNPDADTLKAPEQVIVVPPSEETEPETPIDRNPEPIPETDGTEPETQAPTAPVHTEAETQAPTAPRTPETQKETTAASKETDAPARGAERDYVLNANTHKFHFPGCSSAKRIKAENRIDFHGTREEVISRGYDPCKNCNP